VKKDKEIKLRRLTYLLFFKRHNYPGARDWELEKYLGRNYKDYINDFNEYIKPMGLTVKRMEVKEDDKIVNYYFVVPTRRSLVKGLKMHRWSIDEKAVLAIALSLALTNKDMKVKRRDVEELASLKIPEWRVKRAINRFIREGYLKEREDFLEIGMRSIFEIDLKRLSTLLLSSSEGSSEGDSSDSSQ